MLTKEQIEQQCLVDYQEHAGKILIVTSIEAMINSNSKNIDLDEAVRVRVDENQRPNTVINWTDADWCDPNWDVTLLEPHPLLSQATSLWVFGFSRCTNGSCDRHDACWSVDEDQSAPEATAPTELCHGIRVPSRLDDVVTLCGIHVNTMPEAEREHHTIATSEESITCEVCLAYKGKRRTIDRDGTPVIEDLVIEDGQALVKIGHRLVRQMALAMFQMLDDARAPNCLEAIFEDPSGSGKEVIVTAQRKDGLTPMQLVAKEKTLVDDAVACLKSLRDGDASDAVWRDIEDVICEHDERRHDDAERKAAAEASMALMNEK